MAGSRSHPNSSHWWQNWPGTISLGWICSEAVENAVLTYTVIVQPRSNKIKDNINLKVIDHSFTTFTI